MLIASQQHHDECYCHHHVDEICPPCLPERRADSDGESGAGGILPVLVFLFGSELEGVLAGLQITEYHIVVVIDGVPLLVESLHPVGVFYIVGFGIVLHAERDAQRILLIASKYTMFFVGHQLQRTCIFSSRSVGFAGNNLYVRHAHAVVYQLRVEITCSAGRPEEDGSVRGCCC